MTPEQRGRTRQRLLRLCHQGMDLPVFSRTATEILQQLIRFDGCCWLSLDPATLLPTSHIALNSIRPEDVPRLAQNEYGEDDVNKLAELSRRRSPAAILKQASGGNPTRSPRYQHVLRPNGFEDELRAALVDGAECWGGIALYRRAASGDFALEEAAALGELSAILAEGVRRALLVGSVATSVGEDSPGIIVLDRCGRIETMTPQAHRWLQELLVNSAAEDAVPNVVHAVAYRAQLAALGTEDQLAGAAQARVPTASGRWLVLYGSLLGDLKDKRTAIIIEPARPPQLASLIVRAYRLTEREAEIARLVMQGYSTQDISQALHLSPYTIQDHLKVVFEKVGVRSRRELVAHVFFQHYGPRMAQRARIDADGWFAEE